MIGLVGYGSSDDEDEPPAPAVASEPRNAGADFITNGSTNVGPSSPEQITNAHNVAEIAMVGPSMPNDASATRVYLYESAEQELPPMSERDLLRYLTQPSHPVTSLPLEPTSEADPAVTAKFQRFLELKSKGVHFNEDLAGKSSFKNPSLFASLLERSGLPAESQYISTIPLDVLSVDMLPPWAYKEELLKSQQALNAELEATKKAQSAAGKRTIEFTSARDARSHESIPKRRQR